MIGIHGNDPLFGFGGIKRTQENNQQPQVKETVPVTETPKVTPVTDIEADALDATAAQLWGVHLVQQPTERLTAENVTLTPEELTTATEMGMSPDLAILASEMSIPNTPLNNVALHTLRNDVDGFNVPIDLNKLAARLDTDNFGEPRVDHRGVVIESTESKMFITDILFA